MSNPGIQHATNAAVLALPAASLWSRAPEVVTIAVGVMAFLYYLLYFIKEFIGWKDRREQRKQSGARVLAKHEADRTEVENPDVPSASN